MTCKECKGDQTEGDCYTCAMKKKQSKPIREAYRDMKKGPPDKKKFRELKTDQGSKLITKSIGGQKFALLNFECKMEGSRAVYTFSDFHRYKDVNFFGDRPAVYGFANYGQDGKVKIGEGKNASQRLRAQKGVLKETTLKNRDKTEGFLLFSCGSGTISVDKLRSHNLRLIIERLLQINFKVPLIAEGEKRKEQHVIPDEDELDLAVKLSKWVFDKAPSSLGREGPKFTTKHS